MDLHRQSLVIDMHSDVHLDVIRSRGQGQTHVLMRRHVPLWRQGGVDVVVLNTIPKFAPTPYPYYTSPSKNSLLMFDCIFQEIAESGGELALILEPDDIPRIKAQDRIGIMIGIEGAEAIEYDLALLRCYHRLGLRIMTLTWHQRNLAAEGVSEPGNGGLSRFGEAMVREMNRLGIIVDVSHLSLQGIDDVLAVSTSPIVASHSNAIAVCDHQRNIDDRRLKAIADHGGMAGVVFLGRFVAHTSPTIEKVCDHVDHMTRLIGCNRVGLGPDFTDYGYDLIVEARVQAGLHGVPDRQKALYAVGLESAATLPAFTQALIDRNYSHADIRSILGGNFMTLFANVRSRRQEK